MHVAKGQNTNELRLDPRFFPHFTNGRGWDAFTAIRETSGQLKKRGRGMVDEESKRSSNREVYRQTRPLTGMCSSIYKSIAQGSRRKRLFGELPQESKED